MVKESERGMPMAEFHPLVRGWFLEALGAPTSIQEEGWRSIASGRDTLIAAPTGSGKTLAAFLWAIDRLVRASCEGPLPDRTLAVYVSPLKALGNDIQRNLREPLEAIRARGQADGLDLDEVRVMVRSGDTPAAERRSMSQRPPHVLITTPESLYILLTAEGSRRFLARAETVVVDEIHALAGDKRGAHLALSLERLDHLAGRRLQRIGLSATQRPIQETARLLVGAGRLGPDGSPGCAIVDAGHRRALELSVEVPRQPLSAFATHELWAEVYDRIAELSRAHRTTIVFANTRRLVERIAHNLSERLGEDKVAAHHGSLSRATRLQAERRLKAGELPVVVATASLELGIDVGSVDLVCLVGAPRSLSTLLQRVGRSRHRPQGAVTGVPGEGAPGGGPSGLPPRGVLFPLTRDALLECAAAVRAVKEGELEVTSVRRWPLDVLAQQVVATAAAAEVGEEELWALVRRAYPYRDLPRADFEAVLELVSEGAASRTGRRGAHLHRDRVNGRLRGRRGARLTAITSGGAIPDTADYDVIEEPAGTLVGKVNEDFAVESLAGDIFLLGNRSWRIRRVETGRVRVEDAQGAPPSIPFWLGEAPARSPELSRAVAALRVEAGAGAAPAAAGPPEKTGTEKVGSGMAATEKAAREVASEVKSEAGARLAAEAGLSPEGVEEVRGYLEEARRALGVLPTQDTVVAERFFDESGGMQLVIHAPFGGRINRAWGLALRKRFCRTFDFELQAAATDDGVLLSLAEGHSFPLETIFSLVRSRTLEEDLVQAVLASPMFQNRWRWNVTRALAVPRFQGGRKVPMPLQRMRAEDLLAAVFPAQVGCQDNHPGGPIEPPDHPLVKETIRDCLHEAMDLEGLRRVITAIELGEIRTVAVDTPAPSPLSHEILHSNPYTFLDDAPLEERRARAVALRRSSPDLSRGVGALDREAIAEVRRQAWPDVRDADEIHDALLGLVLLPVADAAPWERLLEELLAARRVVRASWSAGGRVRQAWVASERAAEARAALSEVRLEPEPPPLPRQGPPPGEEQGTLAVVRGWLERLGPTSGRELEERLGLPALGVERALLDLEGDGAALRGAFTPGLPPGVVEWCDRRLLARIHRLTLGRLRREIEPVSAADFIRFLLRWQHLQPGSRLHGRQGVRRVVTELQGIEVPAPAWERDVLPARIEAYDPGDLEALCLSGEVAWARLGVEEQAGEQAGEQDPAAVAAPTALPASRRASTLTRAAPLAFVLREDLPFFLGKAPAAPEAVEGLSPAAREVAAYLARHGASFLGEIARGTGRLAARVEWALWELVARGLVTGDGIAGLRSLLTPERDRRAARASRRGLRMRPAAPLHTGRWSLLHPPGGSGPPGGARAEPPGREEREERMALQLLRRWGVVLRDLLAREGQAPSWRTLLPIYRRLEDQGQIRGGRFVEGLVGEHFALPEAVEALRAVRRAEEPAEPVLVSAADPLNLVGILTPGGRVSPYSGQWIAYRAGVPLEVGTLGALRSRLFVSGAAEGAG